MRIISFAVLTDITVNTNGALSGCRCRAAANTLYEQLLTANKRWSSSLGVDRGNHKGRKLRHVTQSRDWTGFFVVCDYHCSASITQQNDCLRTGQPV